MLGLSWAVTAVSNTEVHEHLSPATRFQPPVFMEVKSRRSSQGSVGTVARTGPARTTGAVPVLPWVTSSLESSSGLNAVGAVVPVFQTQTPGPRGQEMCPSLGG